MRLKAQEIVEIYSSMRNRNVVLYGAGGRGRLALEILEKEGFRVLAVADRRVGISCGVFQTISLQELCESKTQAVCIVTPKIPLPEVWETLKSSFELVADLSIIYWMKYFVPGDQGRMEYTCCFPFHHYESPYPDPSELAVCREMEQTDKLDGIQLNLETQQGFLPKLGQYSSEFFQMQQRKGAEFRYQSDNGWFDDADAALLHSMIRDHHTKKIIEIGSGFSTCVMLDTNEFWLSQEIDITCVEPYPERLLSHIKEKDKKLLHIHQKKIQNFPLTEFDVLEEDDILFIDSSHVARAGGDLPWEYFQILPRLKDGVIIHIHDIFYPFTYPESWLLEGRAYNEAYLLRALLMNNNRYEILFFNHMMAQQYKEEYAGIWDSSRQMTGGSIWIRKKKS